MPELDRPMKKGKPIKDFFGTMKKHSFLSMCAICLTMCVLVCLGFLTHASYIARGGSFRSECIGSYLHIGQGEIVVFHDENFKNALCSVWGKPDREFYTEELEHCTELEIIGEPNITDISDLAWFPNLEKLTISYANIQDISVLSDLQCLTYLDLSYNLIDDMSPLSELAALEKLDLSGNYIAELPEELNQMQRLSELKLNQNRINSIDGLANLPLLTLLQVRYNYISDLNLSESFPMLMILDLTGCPIQEIQTLDMFSVLQELILSRTEIDSLDFVSSISTIASLDISYTGVRDLSILSECKSLESLKLYGFNSIDLTPIKLLPAFNSIYLDYNYNRSEIDFMIDSFKTGDLRTRIYLCGNRNKLND